jgi:hypothetical protein
VAAGGKKYRPLKESLKRLFFFAQKLNELKKRLLQIVTFLTLSRLGIFGEYQIQLLFT